MEVDYKLLLQKYAQYLFYVEGSPFINDECGLDFEEKHIDFTTDEIEALKEIAKNLKYPSY